jgi:hypothetical protein
MDIREILFCIFRQSFPSDQQLITFAHARHGFGGDDGGYGITYASDLDEFDISQGCSIPTGWVEIYYQDTEVTIPEAEYLDYLSAYLRQKGLQL